MNYLILACFIFFPIFNIFCEYFELKDDYWKRIKYMAIVIVFIVLMTHFRNVRK